MGLAERGALLRPAAGAATQMQLERAFRRQMQLVMRRGIEDGDDLLDVLLGRNDLAFLPMPNAAARQRI